MSTTRVQEQYQLWWADAPFLNGPGSKVRPVLLLRKTLMVFNGQRDLYWKAAYVTTQRPKSLYPRNCLIVDWERIGLKYPSWVYPTEEIPVLPTRLIDYIGRISIKDVIGIKRLLHPPRF